MTATKQRKPRPAATRWDTCPTCGAAFTASGSLADVESAYLEWLDEHDCEGE